MCKIKTMLLLITLLLTILIFTGCFPSYPNITNKADEIKPKDSNVIPQKTAAPIDAQKQKTSNEDLIKQIMEILEKLFSFGF